MTDELVAALDEGHRRLRDVLVRMGELPRDSVRIDGAHMRERQVLIRRLRREFVALATVKERALWPAVRRHLVGGEEIAATALEGKRHVELLLDKLRWVAHRDPRVDGLLEQLMTGTREHVDAENALFERLAARIPAGERRHIAALLRDPPRLPPTRQHPDMPTVPWVARLLGPVVAVVDRLRDAVQATPTGL